MRQWSPLARPLFPDEVALAEADPFRMEGTLFPEERELVRNAVDKRRREFACGRTLARKVLGELGCAPQPLLNGSDRAPIWPEGIVGSITHTAHYCAVAAAERSRIESLGIDAEPDDPLPERLWERILTAQERAWIGQHDATEAGRLAKLFFCTKECLYKCQYPLTSQYLGFHDVEIELHTDRDGFEAIFVRDAGSRFRAGDRLAGAFRRAGGFVVAGLTMRR